MKKWLCFALATLCLCLALTGCGNSADTDTTVDTTPDIQPLPDLKVEECYTYTEHENGTYSYSVKSRSGMYILDVRDSKQSAKFAVLDENTLVVHGTTGTGHSQRWAIVCDIEACRSSEAFGGFLAALNGRVAFVEQRTGAYHVFVCDPFAPNEYDTVCTLEGLVTVNGEPITDFVLSAEGVLSVTYAVEGGHKTVEIDLNPAEDM